MTLDPRVVLERLYALAPRGADLGLERVREATARFGHPERKFASIHVAGTNGKGSVSAMTAAMARADGARVGLYTSPHLCRFNERICVDGAPVDDDTLTTALDEVLDRCPELTFFETATVTAFNLFSGMKVDVAVIEVGLGGRLDATNVIETPRVTAITRISFDHTDRLGATLAAIAREKAGIIKPRVPVVTGPLIPEALAEITGRAGEVGARIRPTDRDVELAALVEAHPPSLVGAHQRENAKIAVALGREAGFDDQAIRIGLRDVVWPGRLESLRTEAGEVVLDAAHNPDGARALGAAFAERGLPPSQVALVFGSMADKDYRDMLASLAPLAARRVYVAPEGRRAADPATMLEIAPGEVAPNVSRALEMARQAVGANGVIVVAGSIFLVGAARGALLGLPRDPVIAL